MFGLLCLVSLTCHTACGGSCTLLSLSIAPSFRKMCKTHKFMILPIFGVQFNGIQYVHAAVLPSPSSVSRTFVSP